MRIIKYKDEKFGKCKHCETEFAYINSDVQYYSGGDSVDSVKDFLKWVDSEPDVKKQLTEQQYKTLKKHPDWTCYYSDIQRSVVCPACKRYIELQPILEYIEIFPKDSEIVGVEVIPKNKDDYFYWDEFNGNLKDETEIRHIH